MVESDWLRYLLSIRHQYKPTSGPNQLVPLVQTN